MYFLPVNCEKRNVITAKRSQKRGKKWATRLTMPDSVRPSCSRRERRRAEVEEKDGEMVLTNKR